MPPAPGHDLGLSTAPPPSQLTPHPLFLPCPLISLTARPNLRLLLLAAAVASMAPPPPRFRHPPSPPMPQTAFGTPVRLRRRARGESWSHSSPRSPHTSATTCLSSTRSISTSSTTLARSTMTLHLRRVQLHVGPQCQPGPYGSASPATRTRLSAADAHAAPSASARSRCSAVRPYGFCRRDV